MKIDYTLASELIEELAKHPPKSKKLYGLQRTFAGADYTTVRFAFYSNNGDSHPLIVGPTLYMMTGEEYLLLCLSGATIYDSPAYTFTHQTEQA